MRLFDWFRPKKRSLDWNLPEHGIVIQGIAARVLGIPKSDHEMLGRLVREEWIAWAKEQPNPKRLCLVILGFVCILRQSFPF